MCGTYNYIFYVPPSVPLVDFEKFLDDLVRVVQTKTPNLIAGDFNAGAMEWRSQETNQRGKALLKASHYLTWYW